MNLTIHHLGFVVQATTLLELDQQSGSSVRGLIAHALWSRFCHDKDVVFCADCSLLRGCPVAALVAPMREEHEKGGNQRPRPYVVRPPLSGLRYQRGSTFEFGIGLFGSAADLFPYIVMAADELSKHGLGRKIAHLSGRRGGLQLVELVAYNPLTLERQLLYRHDFPVADSPGLPIGGNDVAAFVDTLPPDRVTLSFQTPMRLVDHGQLVRHISFRPLIQRLMRRLDDLSQAYGDGKLEIDFRGLLDRAETVQVAEDRTQWVDAMSYSSRSKRRTPIGGLVGSTTFVGDIAPFRELLLWGSLVHVGRNVVKGDGWYEIEG